MYLLKRLLTLGLLVAVSASVTACSFGNKRDRDKKEETFVTKKAITDEVILKEDRSMIQDGRLALTFLVRNDVGEYDRFSSVLKYDASSSDIKHTNLTYEVTADLNKGTDRASATTPLLSLWRKGNNILVARYYTSEDEALNDDAPVNPDKTFVFESTAQSGAGLTLTVPNSNIDKLAQLTGLDSGSIGNDLWEFYLNKANGDSESNWDGFVVTYTDHESKDISPNTTTAE